MVCLALGACASPSLVPDPAIFCDSCDSWNQPQSPFRIFGDTFYVGTAGISSILIATDDGLILFDGGLPQSAERIVASIRVLGFDPAEIRVIAVSHAHFDHVGGIAALQRISDARVVTSGPALAALRRGTLDERDPQADPDNPTTSFPPVPEAEAVDDGTVLTVGDTEVRGIYTPGHTPGGMTWTWRTCEADRCLQFVYADSLSPVAAGAYRFSEGLGEALQSSIERVGDLDCDILFATHPFSFGMHENLEQGREAFIDDLACRHYAHTEQARLARRLERERHGQR